jgi:hypothetical protein
MNPRTRRLRRQRRKARKRAAMVADLLRRGYPRLKIAAEMAERFRPYVFTVKATFDG